MTMRKPQINRNDFAIAVSLFAWALFLYVRTLAPSLLTADAAEFQTLSYTLGMTHSSGYPTYIFLGRLFTLIPIHNIAYRVNFMSAFFGALTVGQVYWIIRLLGGKRLGSVVGALALSLAPLFWQRTIFAETYAPAASMIASIWLLVLLWEREENPWYLLVAGLLGGLSLGIHSTVIMTGVSVFIFMLLKARQRKDWLFAGSGAILGLMLTFLAFLYLDYNNPPSSIYNTVYSTNLSGYGLSPEEFRTPMGRLLAIFPAKSFWVYYFSAESGEISRRLSEYVAAYPLWELALILLGAISLFFDKKRIASALYALLVFLLIWGFAVTVEFSVYREFYGPVSVAVYVWLGLGASVFLQGVRTFLAKSRLDLKFSKIAAALLGFVLLFSVLGHSHEDITLAIHSGYTTFIRDESIYPYLNPDRYTRLAERVLRKVEDDAIVFAIWDRLYSYVYTAHIEQGRTSIRFHEVWPSLGETTLQYIAENIDEHPIYFTTLHPEISVYYDLEQVGDQLYRLKKKE